MKEQALPRPTLGESEKCKIHHNYHVTLCRFRKHQKLNLYSASLTIQNYYVSKVTQPISLRISKHYSFMNLRPSTDGKSCLLENSCPSNHWVEGLKDDDDYSFMNKIILVFFSKLIPVEFWMIFGKKVCLSRRKSDILGLCVSSNLKSTRNDRHFLRLSPFGRFLIRF